MKHVLPIVLALAAALPLPVMAGPEPAGIIPREVLFGNPDRRGGNISHDGKYLSWIAPHNGVMNIFVAPADHPDQAKVVTNDTKRGIRSYFWAYDSKTILYTQDVGGDENWKVYAADVTSNEVGSKDLTPIEEIKGPDGKPIMLPTGKPMRPTARIFALADKFPNDILVGLNNRDPQWHDVYRLNLATGKLDLVYANDEWAEFVFDDDFNVRLAMKNDETGGSVWVKNTAESGKKPAWEPMATISMEDSANTSFNGFDSSGRYLYMTEGRGRDTAALVQIDTKTGETKTLAENPKADVGGTINDPKTGIVQAASFTYERTEWTVLDKSIAGDLDYLKTVCDGELIVAARTHDDSKWVVAYMVDNGPVRAYLYDRAAKKANFLYVNNKRLENQPLVKMHPVVIPARDGLNLVSYLTLPPGSDADGNGVPDAPVPMVLNVHGGPWARDDWGLDPEAQWLANRGYACLQVNFRGSTGFGKKFLNAGNKEWAAKMHDDLIDAVNWAVEKNVAVKDKVAIYGGSYGGYATLVGLTFTPETFACGVDIVGPSNIVTLLNSIPPYWAPMIEQMARRVGDHRTDEGKKFLESRSPLTFADKITKPLLIGQGYNDPRVKFTEAEQIVSAMQSKGLPVTYVVFPDEGHGFARPQNRQAFYATAEAFLSKHLGGRAQVIGNDFKGSSVQIPQGAAGVPGVSDALPAAEKK